MHARVCARDVVGVARVQGKPSLVCMLASRTLDSALEGLHTHEQSATIMAVGHHHGGLVGPHTPRCG